MLRFSPVSAALVAAIALALASDGAAGIYADAAGDSGAAGDITGVTVEGVQATGQVVFRIVGTNLATSVVNPVNVSIDSDLDPLTGNLEEHGTEYRFTVDDDSYWFGHWNGAEWAPTPHTTVEVIGDNKEIVISVNRAEIGAAPTFNFVAWTDRLGVGKDSAPNDGVFNYSFDQNGPRIDAVEVKTMPATPRAGRLFVVSPIGLKLPPDGRDPAELLPPDSYSCTAKLGGRVLKGIGPQNCSFAIPKKNVRGKRLAVVLTVAYQGVTKSVLLTFRVG
jgi:hypothetical protein